MQIKDKITETFGNYELETDRIDTSHSLKRDRIVLRYNGVLPESLSGDCAKMIFLVTPCTQRIILEAHGNHYALSASPDEIFSILSGFFFDSDKKTRLSTGLSDYSLGFWQAFFIEYIRSWKLPCKS